MPAELEDQVAAVLELIVRVLIMKPAALLLLQVEGEAQAGGINPTPQTCLSRPIVRASDKVSAIFAKPAASEI